VRPVVIEVVLVLREHGERVALIDDQNTVQ
jgi:hypothetical protein